MIAPTLVPPLMPGKLRVCERCHKEREDSDFAQIASIGVFCSWCRENIQLVIDKYGEKAATGWTYDPRTDLIGLIEGEHKRVLDCGCWAGYTMQALQEAGHAAYGLDIEDNRTTAKNLPFIEADLQNPPELWQRGFDRIRIQDFDYVLFGDVLEHLADPLPALHAAKRWLAPEGRIIISMPNAGWIGSVLQIANQKFPRDESGHFDRTHLRFYTRETLKDTLIEAGFANIRFYSKQLPETVPWPEHVAADSQQLFQWDNVTISCDRDHFEQLNTYQILAVAWP